MSNDFKLIDTIINNWNLNKKLQIATKYKEYDVRIIHKYDSLGRKFSIGIIIENANQVRLNVSAWDFKKRNQSVLVNISELKDCLDKFVNLIDLWIMEDSNQL